MSGFGRAFEMCADDLRGRHIHEVPIIDIVVPPYIGIKQGFLVLGRDFFTPGLQIHDAYRTQPDFIMGIVQKFFNFLYSSRRYLDE